MSKERRKSLIAYSLLDGIEDCRIRYVLTILQDEDADPNYLLHDRGIAPIHMAIGHESKAFALEVTGVLLQYGANPNICSAEGMTPVHIASAWGRARLLRLLLFNGGNPWLEDDEGKNAFHFAFEESHTAALQVLEDFRLKDSGKFDDWPELCDPNPKFTIALDKVLLYNHEVLLSYQARVPFAGCSRRSASTQTTPPVTPPLQSPPPLAPPLKSPALPSPDKRRPTPRAATSPVAASTTALQRFSFVLSDIRNKVVSQVTLRKTAHRPLSRRTALGPAPSTAPLSFLDELRQRQSAGLRHVATQMSPPPRAQTKLVRDEVMVRVSASPAQSGDESRGSDEFESRLDRAFRHLEDDAAFTGEAVESLDEEEPGPVTIGPGPVLVESQPPRELRLDLSCLHAIQEEPSSKDDTVDSCDLHYVTSNGLDHASKASPPHENIPYGIHDSSFGVSHSSFGTNFVSANASIDNTSLRLGNHTSYGVNNKTQDNNCIEVGCGSFSGTNNQTSNDIPNGLNDASFQGQNDSLGANLALFRTSSNSSSLKTAWLEMNGHLSIDVRDQCLSDELHEQPSLRDESRDMFAESLCDVCMQPPLDDALRDVNSDTSRDLLGAEAHDVSLNVSSMSAPQSPGSESLLMVTARSQQSTSTTQARPIQARGSSAVFNQTSADANHSRESYASTSHTSAINCSSLIARAKDSIQNPCEINTSSADCQDVPREDGCSVVWESAMDASDSFSSCRGDAVLNSSEALCNGTLSNGVLTKGALSNGVPSNSVLANGGRENGCQEREDVVKHSFVTAATGVSTEFISDDDECFGTEPCADHQRSEPLAGNNSGGFEQGSISKAAPCPRWSWSSDSLVSASEEYVYTDEEEGVVLVERRFLVPPSDADSSGGSLPAELDGYDTDCLRAELRKHGVEPGPILPSTKRVYLKKLQRAVRGRTQPDLKQTYSCELDRSLRDETWSADLAQYEALESEMSAPFAVADPRKCWREGVLKSSFCYLLLDPRISANLPCRAANTPPAEAWATFLEAVFYVGKGKRSRPYSHLYQAVGVWKTGGRARDAKTQQILDIWAAGLGVVCLHVFQNVIPVEAYTREAAMLDALTLARVQNARRSEYYGVAATWPAKRRNMLGTLLLHKAMRIFFGEGERQLRPGDIGQ